MNGLSASALADLAGTTAAEVERLVNLGVLVARDWAGPFLETDVQKVRLATACEQAGLPMDGIASAIRAGRIASTPGSVGSGDRLDAHDPARSSCATTTSAGSPCTLLLG